MSRQTADERFWSKVDTRGDCWLWQGALSSHGYGNFYIAGRTVKAHRYAFGPVPPGKMLDHLCRNRRCVRPAHLEPVTNRENLNRGEGESNRLHRAGVCRNGHSVRTHGYRTPHGKMQCRLCQTAATGRRRAQNRAAYNAYMRDYKRRQARNVLTSDGADAQAGPSGM